jgi:hypothetical protein
MTHRHGRRWMRRMEMGHREWRSCQDSGNLLLLVEFLEAQFLSFCGLIKRLRPRPLRTFQCQYVGTY